MLIREKVTRCLYLISRSPLITGKMTRDYQKTGQTACQCQCPVREAGSVTVTQQTSQHGCQTLSPSTPSSRTYHGQTTSCKYMIVGLGNMDLPRTRHSVGMMAVDVLAKWLKVDWKKERHMKALVAQTTLANLDFVLIKSKLPMNLSGKSVHKAVQEFEVPTNHVYLLQDDLDLGLGKYKIKERGSALGHNGVKSCIQHLRSEDMKRLRIGISRPADQSQVIDYVLRPFDQEERLLIKGILDGAALMVMKHIQKQQGLHEDIIKQTDQKVEDKES